MSGDEGFGGELREREATFWRQVWTRATVVKALVEEREEEEATEGGGCQVGI